MENNFNIVDLFFEKAALHPHKIAIIDNEKAISFGDFAKQVKDMAVYFQQKGIKRGDRVMIFVPMSIDLYRSVLALFRIGATAVFLDEWVSKKRMEICCQVADCQAFIGIFKARFFAFFSSELRRIPIKLGVYYENKSKLIFEKTDTNPDETALITFTTGSTGTPKAAKRTHGFLREQFNALSEKIDPQEDDIDMPVLPIVLLINLGIGCTSVISDFKASKPDAFKPENIVTLIQQHKVTRMVASPFFVKALSQYIIKNNTLLNTVNKVFTGGAPVFPNEAELYHEAFPNAKVEVVYGSTEAEPISSINVIALIQEKENLLKSGLAVGLPYHKTSVKIIEIRDETIVCNSDLDLQAMELSVGNIGEIIVSGSHVLQAYFNNDGALRRNKIFIGNACWHRTGDSGYLDAKGQLFLTGRCNTLIGNGENMIAPFVYENYLQSIIGVEIGTILSLDNQVVIVLELQKNGNELLIENQISNLKIKFDTIKVLKKIPRDPRHNSKIDYEKLKVMLR